MTNDENRDVAPEDTGQGTSIPQRKGRKVFRNITRELSDEDLQNTAVQRMLLDDIERLELERDELTNFRKMYHESDKKVAVLEEKNRSVVAIEIICGACLVIGGAAIGIAPTIWQDQPAAWILLIFGGILVAGAVIARLVKK